MKALRGIDGSLCGAILSNRSPTLSTAATRAHHRGQPRSPRTSRRPQACRGRCAETPDTSPATSRCSRTSSWLLSTFLPTSFIQQDRPFCPGHQQARRYGHAAVAAHPPRRFSSPGVSNVRPEELLAVVDDNDPGSVEEHLKLARDPYLRRYAQPDGPNLTVSDKREDYIYPSQEQAVRGDPRVQQITEKMRLALATRQRHPKRVPLRKIEVLYRALPQPRMLNLPAAVRHRLLKAVGLPTQRNAKSMLRYFYLVDEVKSAGLAVSRREWNTALSFASQCVGQTRHADMESALQLWNEMERMGERANAVTFNILFDAAAKSGNFTLAEKIYSQMDSRGIEFNRYHHVSLIHFFGLKGDADGVRAAYQEMVKAGEMIDTVVFNCLIVSFFRAGDEAAALRVYDHMKGTGSVPLPRPDSRNLNKMMTEVLMMFSKIGRDHPSAMATFQKLAPTNPDLRTYRILVSHYAETVGNLNMVMQYLDEMRWFNIPIHGSIFLALFKGFAKYGSRGTFAWSEERLRKVLSSLLQVLDEKNTDMYIDSWLVGWALRAFMTCAGREAVLEVYDEFQSRWHFSESRVAHMEDFLSEVLRGSVPSDYRPEEGGHDLPRSQERP